MSRNAQERGQALVLILLMLLAALAFAALAVDGGRIYSEQRRAQSAADAAAYAAARVSAEGGNWRQAAIDQLLLNGYDDADLRVNPGRAVDVVIYNPPHDGPYSPGQIDPNDDPNQYFQVKITQRVEQSFSRLVFNGPFQVTVDSVVRARPSLAVSNGNAIHATSPDQCDAIRFINLSDTRVDGGNVFSNSSAASRGCPAAVQKGLGWVRIIDGEIRVAGSWEIASGAGAVSPAPVEGHPLSGPPGNVVQGTLLKVPPPNCSGLPARDTGSGPDLLPGVYNGGITISSGTWTLDSGVYCLRGDLEVSGGQLVGSEVLIVMLSGDVEIFPEAEISLTRISDTMSILGKQYGGMLLYMPEENSGRIDLSGVNPFDPLTTVYAGTIYAPTAACSLHQGGGGTFKVKSNLVCATVNIYGNAQIEIYYRAEQNFRMPPLIELTE